MAKEMDPDHPIIDKPWEYDIVELRYHVDPEDWRGAFIDLHLKKGNVLRRLRFIAPQNLQIGQGFPQPTRGLCILDVRHRQLDSIGVEVADFEASDGVVTFLAWKVVDLDSEVLENEAL